MKSLVMKLRAAFQAMRSSGISMQYLENELHKAMLWFFLWQMAWEHQIGQSTGMDPRYLAKLREDITNMEGDLLKLEIKQ